MQEVAVNAIELRTLTHLPARTAWGEARGEGAAGLHAVLNVIQNRSRTPGWWGTTFDECAIAVEGKEYRQFSCWNEGDANRSLLIKLDASDKIYGTAILMETLARRGSLVDITNGADSYFRIGSKTPFWATKRTPVATIGHHVFFKIGLVGT